MKINLTVRNDNNTEKVQYDVLPANIFQITEALKIANSVLKLAREDEDLQQLFAAAMETDKDEQASTAMIGAAMSAFEVVIFNLPEKAFELLAALSGVEKEVIVQQTPEDAFEIYDAILEVNDVEKIVKRAKKSLALTKVQTKFLQSMKKAKETKEAIKQQ